MLLQRDNLNIVNKKMSYNYRQGGTPDHVDSSQSNAKYPHVGIPVAAADATSVSKSGRPGNNIVSDAAQLSKATDPTYPAIYKKQDADSADSSYKADYDKKASSMAKAKPLNTILNVSK